MIIFFIMLLILLLEDTIFFLHYSKKCKYDCSKCRYWPCPSKTCCSKRDKFNKNLSKGDED